jgi:HK97 family phage major capsid protein
VRAAEDDAEWAAAETRSTQTVVGTSAAGGYALPEVIEQQIARLSVDISPIRQIATVRTVGTTDYTSCST